MFAMRQANLFANKRRKFIVSTHISESRESVNFHWSPFPIEMTGMSAFVPSPSGLKLLVVRNHENESPTQFEIWSSSQLEKEFFIPRKVHGSVYVDGWFEGISWNFDETHVAYVAEEPSHSKPTFNRKGDSLSDDCGSWKGQGDWEEDIKEGYAGKRQPALFVISLDSGEVQTIKGIPKSLIVGQVIWSPNNKDSAMYLVFVGWSGGKRKLGFHRPCAIYAIKLTDASSTDLNDSKNGGNEASPLYNLTKSISSGFSPRFRFPLYPEIDNLLLRSAVARNPVCNIASMFGITDIPDWCFFETYGDMNHYTEAPSLDDLSRFHQMSPIAHVSKVKTPTLFLLGTKDLRVPMSNGLQFMRALKEKGVQTKVLVFPNDNYPLDRPQTNFESFLNIGCWFKKYCKL